jgi:hypothetical protein
MGRLVAFDQQTASSLVARTRTAAQLGHGSPLRAALATEDEATLLMPGAQRDQLLIVSVRRQPARAALVPPPVLTASAQPTVAAVPIPRTRAEEVRPEVKRVEVRQEDVRRTEPKKEDAKQEDAKRQEAKREEVRPEPVKQATPIPPASPTKPPVDDNEPVGYEATGFLGLENSPVYAEDVEEQARNKKKKWWQKLLD